MIKTWTSFRKWPQCDRFSLVSKKFHEKLLLYSLLCSSPLQLPATSSHVLIITLYLPEDTETAEDSLFPPQIKTRLQRTQMDASIWYSLGLHPEIIRSHQTSSQHWFLPELGHILSPQCTLSKICVLVCVCVCAWLSACVGAHYHFFPPQRSLCGCRLLISSNSQRQENQ